MFHIIKSYIVFLWHSKNEHAVHSPFVFHFITKCLYDKKEFPEYTLLKNYRQALLQNKSTIAVTDFGAGSRVFKTNDRSISKIASTAGITEKRAQLLFRVTKYFSPEKVLEIGTSLGLATAALALANKHTQITTIEGCPQTAQTASEQLQLAGLNNITTVVSEFKSYLLEQQSVPTSYNLIYFDGNHQKQPTLDYFEMLLPTATNDSVWIFDDIHWSAAMEEAWETIKKHPRVTVTIDTFQWGIVFFRKEQPEQHFVIRT